MPPKESISSPAPLGSTGVHFASTPPVTEPGHAKRSTVRQSHSHSIIQLDPPHPVKKGVEFNPEQVTADQTHDYENSTRKGHLVKKGPGVPLVELDLSGKHGKRVFCENLDASLYPLSMILSLVGRFPVTRGAFPVDGVYEYQSNCSSMNVFRFNVTTAALIFVLIVGTYNITTISFNVRPLLFKAPSNLTAFNQQRMYDKALIQRNMIPLIILSTTLLQAIISSVLLSRKHQYLAHILSFMNKSAHTMHMDLAGASVTNFTTQSSAVFIVVICSLIMTASLKLGPGAIGLSKEFGSLTMRLFLGSRSWTDDSSLSRAVALIGGLLLVAIFTSAVAPILLFIYKCKILRNGFACWNGRAYCALLRGLESRVEILLFAQEKILLKVLTTNYPMTAMTNCKIKFAQTEEARTTYNLLFKDHCVLLDLADSVDQMYAFTIESFFGLQVISLFFELYFFLRVGSQNVKLIPGVDFISSEKRYTYIREYDWIPTLIILFSGSVLLFATGKAAASVAEEARAGFEVLRRKGVIGRKTDQELEFMFSMCYSFDSYKRLDLSGAGYLYYNKAFLILLVAVTLFCLLLLVQFKPVLDYEPNMTGNDPLGEFLKITEGSSYAANSSDWKDGRLWRMSEI